MGQKINPNGFRFGVNKNLTELLNYIIDKIEETNDIPVESVKLDNNFLIVKQDSITKLKVKVLPEENTEKLVWISGDKSIATISENGILTAIKPGTTFIKVYFILLYQLIIAFFIAFF